MKRNAQARGRKRIAASELKRSGLDLNTVAFSTSLEVTTKPVHFFPTWLLAYN